MIEQLTLPIMLHDDATFSNYVPGVNAFWVDYLRQFILGYEQNDRYLFLTGQPGAGCSHLLQACCREVLANQKTAVYINFEQQTLKPGIFENLEQFYLVCLDEIHHVMGRGEWEEGLFHLFNRVSESGALLIINASCTPQYLPIRLADLVSRLASGLLVYLHNLNDEEKMIALRLRAAQRGLTLTPEVGQFLLRHYPRDMSKLFAALAQLDNASLIAKRKLTIPFIKEVLSI